jgi:hypothetical protein
MISNNVNVKRLTSALSRNEAGIIRPSKRFTGGSYQATRKVSSTLLRPESFYRRLLATLASSRTPISSNELTKRFNDQYSQNKSRASINARLGELYVYGLVEHGDINSNGGLWFLKPGIDAFNTAQIVSVAMYSLECLHKKQELQLHD